MKDIIFGHPLLMGIVNITPDSFYDGGKYFVADKAYAHLQKLLEDGADIIDIGAASSRPGYKAVSEKEELSRLQPLWDRIHGKDIVFSIDTDKPAVARTALEAGATIINHTGTAYAEMAALAKEYGAYLVLMFHGPFATNTLVREVTGFFHDKIAEAESLGVVKEKLILDPGIGFEMTEGQALELVRATDLLCDFNLPLLLGMSNKRMIGALSGMPPGERAAANIAAELYVIDKGAAILRVHDIAASRSALKTYLTLKGGI